MVGIKHESMRKGQTSHKKEHNTRMCFPLKPVFTRDKERLPNFIDEPTAGLDPEERLRFYNLLSELAVERIILLSTHIASDIEATCSKAAVLSSGTVVFEGQIEKLLQLGNGKVYTTTILQNELNQFKQKYRVISIYQNGINVSCRFLSNAAPKKEWVSCQPTIEDSYMYLLSSFKQEVE